MTASHSRWESQPRRAVSCSAFLFLSGQLLSKLCLSSHFLCHYFLQEPKQTRRLTETHQPLHQKKRHRKKTSQHRRGPGTQNFSFGAKRDNSYPLYLLFSPSTPPSSSFPVPHGQTQRVSSAGILARGSRTLDVPGSQSFRPCSIRHLCSGGARRLGGGLKVGHPEPVYVLVLEALQWGFQEPHLSKVWSFLTMAPQTGLKKWWYAASKGTLCARKRPFTGRELTSILTSLLHHWFPLHPSMGEVGPII